MNVAAIDEWERLFHLIILSLIFSYLTAKLLAIFISFNGDDRDAPVPVAEMELLGVPDQNDDVVSTLSEQDPILAEKEMRATTTIMMPTTIGKVSRVRSWMKLWVLLLPLLLLRLPIGCLRRCLIMSNSSSMAFIAIEGPCSTPQPSALKMTSHAKWV